MSDKIFLIFSGLVITLLIVIKLKRRPHSRKSTACLIAVFLTLAVQNIAHGRHSMVTPVLGLLMIIFAAGFLYFWRKDKAVILQHADKNSQEYKEAAKDTPFRDVQLLGAWLLLALCVGFFAFLVFKALRPPAITHEVPIVTPAEIRPHGAVMLDGMRVVPVSGSRP